MKRYVLVVESSDESGQRGVDYVYGGPDGRGFAGEEVTDAQDAIRGWLDETGRATSTTTVTVVELLELFPSPRPAVIPVVESVTPPVTELWEVRNDVQA